MPDIAKQAAGKAAAHLVEKGMKIGLGTGTTVYYFLQELGLRCKQGLKIEALPTSIQTAKMATDLGISLLDENTCTSLDLAIDGADEVDLQKNLIKGGGGALLREKIVAAMSEEFIVIADHRKLVKHLGAFPLPVEITPFGSGATIAHIEALGFKSKLRTKDGKPYISDNHNFILDLHTHAIKNPKETDAQIKAIPGVVTTGLFFDLVDRLIIGYDDGKVVES